MSVLNDSFAKKFRYTRDSFSNIFEPLFIKFIDRLYYSILKKFLIEIAPFAKLMICLRRLISLLVVSDVLDRHVCVRSFFFSSLLCIKSKRSYQIPSQKWLIHRIIESNCVSLCRMSLVHTSFKLFRKHEIYTCKIEKRNK